MLEYSLILEVLNYHHLSHSYREIERLTGVSKSCCHLWKTDYYNNYNNLAVRYEKNHKDHEKDFFKLFNNEIFK
jgi:hypothetical protein